MDAVDNFYTDQYNSSTDTRQRRTKDILNIFQKGSIINFENTALHKYLVQKSKSLWMTRSQMTEQSVLVLIQKWY